MNLKLEPEEKLSQFPINNILQIDCHLSIDGYFSNAFIISKENSNFLQKIMKKIEVTNYKIKIEEMNTYTKLINKNKMILHHTSPTNLFFTIEENDSDYFFWQY